MDIRVSPGQIASTGCTGPGKSTLLNILAGLDTADSGDVLAEHINLGNLTSKCSRDEGASFCGFVFQSYYLIPELSALENVIMARRIQGPVNRADRERASALLAQLGVEHRDGLPNQLGNASASQLLERSSINRN